MKKALACKSCGGKVKMKSGGKVKRYQDAGTTEKSAAPPSPMSKSDFKNAKKAKRQQTKLDKIGNRGIAGKISAGVGAGSGVVALASQVKDLFKRDQKKKGGTTRKKK